MLRLVGFCGADDNTNITDIIELSKKYSFIEWGILFHSEKIGEPRYPSWGWIYNLVKNELNLAAHFCGKYVNDLLCGKTTFVDKIINLGFSRIQINATKANQVDLNQFSNVKYHLSNVFNKYPEVEFILQRNTETEDLCLQMETCLLPNVSYLYDASCGLGVYDQNFLENINVSSITRNIGFAGGFSPDNISQVLNNLKFKKFPGKMLWIDMESGLRCKNYFSIELAEKIGKKVLLQL